MAKNVKYLRVGGNPNNPKDYENCSNVGNCQRHVHIEKIKAQAEYAKALAGNPSAMFEAIQEGAMTLDEFESFVETQNSPRNSESVEEIARAIINPKNISIPDAQAIVGKLETPEELAVAAELFLESKKNYKPYTEMFDADRIGVALVTADAIPENDRLAVLDTLSYAAKRRAIGLSEDSTIIDAIYHNSESYRGELEADLMANPKASLLTKEGILEENSGFVVEYIRAHGWDDTADKYAKEFYANPKLTSEKGKQLYPDTGWGSAVSRKNAVDSQLMRNADEATAKSVMANSYTYQAALPLDIVLNPKVEPSFLKENADKIAFGSSEAKWAIQDRKDISDKVRTKLEEKSDNYWTTEISQGDITYGKDPRGIVLDNGFAANHAVGRFYSQEDEYNKLLDRMARSTNKSSPNYRKLEMMKSYAEKWKDVLKVRDAFKQ